MHLVRVGGRNVFQIRASGWDKQKIQQIDGNHVDNFLAKLTDRISTGKQSKHQRKKNKTKQTTKKKKPNPTQTPHPCLLSHSLIHQMLHTGRREGGNSQTSRSY